MVKIKTIFFCGHESRYGQAHLEPLLKSDVFEVEEIVLATFERWNKFQSSISGNLVSPSFFEELKFRSRARLIIEKVKKIKNTQIRFVDDVNTNVEFEKAKKYDLAVSVAYPQIFDASLFGAPRIGAINFHPSFLPRCRGAHPVYWTIASQEPFGGVSCHIMMEKIDAGPILAQRKIEFDKDKITYVDLYKMVEAETPYLCKDVEKYFMKNSKPLPQVGTVSYFRNEQDIHKKIFFNTESPDQISAKIRAGGAYAFNRFGRKIDFLPPVEINRTSEHVSNNVEKILTNGTVISLSEHKLELMVQNQYLLVNYHVSVSDRKSKLLKMIAYFIWMVLSERKINIGEVLI